MKRIISTSTLYSLFCRKTLVVCIFATVSVFAGCLDPSGSGASYNDYSSGIIAQSDRDLTAVMVTEGSPSTGVAIEPPFVYHVTDYTVYLTENYSSVDFTATLRNSSSSSATIEAFDFDGTSIGAATVLSDGIAQGIALSLDEAPGGTAPVVNHVRITVDDSTDTKSYTFHIRPKFSNVNYGFNGGIDAFKNSFDSDYNTWQTINGLTIEGIITAKDLYDSSIGEKSFFLQDQDDALLIGSDTTIPFNIGDRVRLTFSSSDGTINTYNVSYSNPLVTSYDTMELVSTGNPVYFQSLVTVTDVTPSHYCKTYRYTDSDGILTDPDRFSSGTFDNTGNNNYTSSRSVGEYLKTGNRGDFYGPVFSSYGEKIFVHSVEALRIFE